MTATVRPPFLKAETVGDVLLVQFVAPDILDDHAVGLIDRQIAALVGESPRKLLLSFRGVRRLSSLLAGKLVALHRKAAAAGGELVLCDIAPDLYEIFEILRLPRLLKIYRREVDALARMQAGR